MSNLQGRAYSEHDLDFIREHYRTMTHKDIASRIDRTESSVKSKCSKMGLTKNDMVFTKKDVSYLIENYANKTAKEIAKDLNKKTTTIQNKAFQLGLLKPMYNYNTNFFEVVDSEEKAYWLGFLYADGCVRGLEMKARVEVGLQIGDKTHLQKLVESIDGNQNIYVDKDQTVARLSICSTKMAQDLIKLGCIPRKTYARLRLPKLSHSLTRHFIRGFVDGDGWLSVGDYFSNQRGKTYRRYDFGIASNYTDILKDIQLYFESHGIVSHIAEREDCCSLKTSSRKSVKSVIDLLYSDCTIFLDRKHIKAKEILKELAPY